MKKNFIILIPARSGSIRVKNKNLRKVNKKSLLELKVKSCLKIKSARVIVSTNSKKIKKKALECGAEVPYLRSDKYSTSKSSTFSCVLDFLRHLIKYEKSVPEFIAILPPTNPFLKTKSILMAYKKIKSNPKINSVVGYVASTDHPFQFVDVGKKKILFNLIKYKNKKYSDFERTQDWPFSYTVSPSLKIVRTNYFKKYLKNFSPVINLKTFDIKNSLGVEIKKIENFDINTLDDLKIANSLSKI